MPLTIVRQDITKMTVDAVVNAANTELKMGGGVCGAIFMAAGVRELQAACDKLAPIKTGEAVITPGFNLPAKYVIHAAGPIFHLQDRAQSEKLLWSAYTNALRLAVINNCESIAFPLISSGIYGYPKDEALTVATSAIAGFLTDYDIDVSLSLLGKVSFIGSRELLGDVENYIDEHFEDDGSVFARNLVQPDDDYRQASRLPHKEVPHQRDKKIFASFVTSPTPDQSQKKSIAQALPHSTKQFFSDLEFKLGEPFSKTLLRLIETKGKTSAEIYKQANIDRRLFSKIRSNDDYMPSKRTAVAFAVALELSLEETADLLERAGYALSHSQKFDVIVEYFIRLGKYNIFEINEVLFYYDQPLLGG
jgi:O-acetyl-ADP-ribose deacetylase (regulator of RNase III)